MQLLKKISPESIRANAGNPNIDLQTIGIYSKTEIQHHIHTQQFHELLTKMDTIQRLSIDQTSGFSDIYTQDYSGLSINKILLDDQIKEYKTKLSTTPNTYDNSQNNTNTMPTAPQLQTLNHKHPLSLVPRNFRNIALTEHISSKSISHKARLRSNYPQRLI